MREGSILFIFLQFIANQNHDEAGVFNLKLLFNTYKWMREGRVLIEKYSLQILTVRFKYSLQINKYSKHEGGVFYIYIYQTPHKTMKQLEII